MRYCKRCVMPDTRPGITFNSEGVCSACQAYDNRKNVDYSARFKELKTLCDKHRRTGNEYDCIIAVSGGKDSHFQTNLIKNVLGMNPLLVTVEDNFPLTNAGAHNLKNISEQFGCDLISMKPNIRAQKSIMRYTFEQYAKPTYFIDRYIYTYPIHMAVKFGIPLIFYGENVSYEYGGVDATETPSAMLQLLNGVASGIDKQELIDCCGVVGEELNFFDAPTPKEIAGIESVYISYFVEWNSFENYRIAKLLGFHDLTHEWTRTHHVEQFDQVDSRAYLVHSWLKYPKFGHASATDYASRMIRYGKITREQAVELVKKHDHDLDPLCVRDFCQFLGYSESTFWDIVESFYNPELFDDNNKLKAGL